MKVRSDRTRSARVDRRIGTLRVSSGTLGVGMRWVYSFRHERVRIIVFFLATSLLASLLTVLLPVLL